MPAAVGGWRMIDVHCDETSLTANWQRDKGFSSPPKSFVIDDSGTSAVFSVSLPVPKARDPEKLIDPVEVTRRYLGQNWPGSISRIPDDPAPARRQTTKVNGIRRRRPGLSVLLLLQCQSCLGIHRCFSAICREQS